MSRWLDASPGRLSPAVDRHRAANDADDDVYRLLVVRWCEYQMDFPPLALPSLLETLLFEALAEQEPRPA